MKKIILFMMLIAFLFSSCHSLKKDLDNPDLTPEEFQQKMAGYEKQLKEYFNEGHKLEEEILKGLGELQYEKM